MGDIVADIDSVLATGEPEPAVELCPHCEEEWHGLPITQQMRDMACRGHLDDGYRYSDDVSEVLCPGAGVDAVMLRRPAPCRCDWCSGRGFLAGLVAAIGQIGVPRGGIRFG